MAHKVGSVTVEIFGNECFDARLAPGASLPNPSTVVAKIVVRKRWFFWPAIFTISLLGKLGLLRDQQKAGKWLAENAMRIEVR